MPTCEPLGEDTPLCHLWRSPPSSRPPPECFWSAGGETSAPVPGQSHYPHGLLQRTRWRSSARGPPSQEAEGQRDHLPWRWCSFGGEEDADPCARGWFIAMRHRRAGTVQTSGAFGKDPAHGAARNRTPQPAEAVRQGAGFSCAALAALGRVPVTRNTLAPRWR